MLRDCERSWFSSESQSRISEAVSQSRHYMVLKKPTKKMVASMPWCCWSLYVENRCFPPHTPSPGWTGTVGISLATAQRKDPLWVTIDRRTPPCPSDAAQVTPEQSEKPSPATLQCAWGPWHILSLLPSVLKGMVWWLIVHLTLHFIFIQFP